MMTKRFFMRPSCQKKEARSSRSEPSGSLVVGTLLFVWARREKNLQLFTPVEWILLGVIAVAGLIGLYLIITGAIDVFNA